MLIYHLPPRLGLPPWCHLQLFLVAVSHQGTYKAFLPLESFPPKICPLHPGQVAPKPWGLKA